MPRSQPAPFHAHEVRLDQMWITPDAEAGILRDFHGFALQRLAKQLLKDHHGSTRIEQAKGRRPLFRIRCGDLRVVLLHHREKYYVLRAISREDDSRHYDQLAQQADPDFRTAVPLAESELAQHLPMNKLPMKDALLEQESPAMEDQTPITVPMAAASQDPATPQDSTEATPSSAAVPELRPPYATLLDSLRSALSSIQHQGDLNADDLLVYSERVDQFNTTLDKLRDAFQQLSTDVDTLRQRLEQTAFQAQESAKDVDRIERHSTTNHETVQQRLAQLDERLAQEQQARNQLDAESRAAAAQAAAELRAAIEAVNSNHEQARAAVQEWQAEHAHWRAEAVSNEVSRNAWIQGLEEWRASTDSRLQGNAERMAESAARFEEFRAQGLAEALAPLQGLLDEVKRVQGDETRRRGNLSAMVESVSQELQETRAQVDVTRKATSTRLDEVDARWGGLTPRLEALQAEISTALAEQRAAAAAELDRLRQDQQAEIARLQAEQARQIERLRSEQAARVDQILSEQQTLAQQLTTSDQQWRQQLAQAARRTQVGLEKQEAELGGRLHQCEAHLPAVGEQVAALQESLEELHQQVAELQAQEAARQAAEAERGEKRGLLGLFRSRKKPAE